MGLLPVAELIFLGEHCFLSYSVELHTFPLPKYNKENLKPPLEVDGSA